MTYCVVPDLLTGDMPINLSRAEQFIQAAADEIDMRLATVYTWPYVGTLPAQAALVLKRINVLIGTGRLVMAQAVGSEDDATNAYGTYLLREGQMLIDAVLSGDLVLTDVPKEDTTVTGNAPTIYNEDIFPGMDAFYGYTMRGEMNPFIPGRIDERI